MTYIYIIFDKQKRDRKFPETSHTGVKYLKEALRNKQIFFEFIDFYEAKLTRKYRCGGFITNLYS